MNQDSHTPETSATVISTLVRLDPSTISVRWEHRHQNALSDHGFEQLRQDIREKRGNIIPIKVRPAPEIGSSNSKYELIWGYRRLRICEELMIEVLAIIEDVTDRKAIIDMMGENNHRAGLSAFEQGRLYRQAQPSFGSQSEMAAALNAPASDVTRALQCVALPSLVLTAFGCPTRIPFGVVSTLWKTFGNCAEESIGEESRDRIRNAAAHSEKASPKNIADYITLGCAELKLGDDPSMHFTTVDGVEGKVVRGTQTRITVAGELTNESLEKLLPSLKKLKFVSNRNGSMSAPSAREPAGTPETHPKPVSKSE